MPDRTLDWRAIIDADLERARLAREDLRRRRSEWLAAHNLSPDTFRSARRRPEEPCAPIPNLTPEMRQRLKAERVRIIATMKRLIRRKEQSLIGDSGNRGVPHAMFVRCWNGRSLAAPDPYRRPDQGQPPSWLPS